MIALLIVIITILISMLKINYMIKAKQCFKDGFLVSFSKLPNFYHWSNDYQDYYKLINQISKLNIDNHKTMLNGNKISIKIRQLGVTQTQQIDRFLRLARYAKSKKVFVWISCVLPSDRNLEMHCYKKSQKLGNVGITLATYHSDVVKKVKKVLSMKGHIRLVKGYYYGDLSNQWDLVTENYLQCAKLLLKSKRYHCLATHDFNILSELYDNIIHRQIEVAYFYKAKSFAEFEMRRRNMNFPLKSVYIPSGNLLPYLATNLTDLDLKRIMKRELNGILTKLVSLL